MLSQSKSARLANASHWPPIPDLCCCQFSAESQGQGHGWPAGPAGSHSVAPSQPRQPALKQGRPHWEAVCCPWAGLTGHNTFPGKATPHRTVPAKGCAKMGKNRTQLRVDQSTQYYLHMLSHIATALGHDWTNLREPYLLQAAGILLVLSRLFPPAKGKKEQQRLFIGCDGWRWARGHFVGKLNYILHRKKTSKQAYTYSIHLWMDGPPLPPHLHEFCSHFRTDAILYEWLVTLKPEVHPGWLKLPVAGAQHLLILALHLKE